MTLGFSKKTYSQIYQELGEARSWLASLNIRTVNTRFEEILQNVQVINERYSKDPSSVISGNIDIETFWYSLTDAYSIIDVYESLKTLKSDKRPLRMRIPVESFHSFRLMVSTHSVPKFPPIPVEGFHFDH